MQFDDLRRLGIAAARELVERADDASTVEPTMVVPGGARTRLLALRDFPVEDRARHDYLAAFADDELSANRVPAWAFVVAAEVNEVDAVVVVYGARQHQPELTAAPLEDDGLGDFVEPEPLDPTAMPFLHPLQHAVDALPAEPRDRLDGPIDFDDDSGLPLFGG